MDSQTEALGQIAADVDAGIRRLEAENTAQMPALAPRIQAWIRTLSHTERPADYFLHPEAYPLLQLPYWCLKSLEVGPDHSFRQDLVYAALNGYYYLRVLDNLMDGHDTVEREILPALNFFHTNAQLPFTAYFDHAHPFWERYRAWWFQFAEATWRDAQATDIDREQFLRTTAVKTCPEKILLAAVCFRHDRPERIERWTSFAEAFGRWHQMRDDLTDWVQDHKAGVRTYFLSEAGRRGVSEDLLPAWVAREGFSWGLEELEAWSAGMMTLAVETGSAPLGVYLEMRKELSDARSERMLAGLQALVDLQGIIGGASV